MTDLLNTDIAVEVHHDIAISIEILHHSTNIAPIPEIDTNMKETLLLHNITDLDVTIIDAIQTHVAIPVLDTDHVQDTTHFSHTLLQIDLH